MTCVDTLEYERLLRASRKTTLPRYIKQLVCDLKDLPDDNERAKYLISIFYQRRQSGAYAAQQFKHYKPILCPTATVNLDVLAFDRHSTGPQIRLGSVEKMDQYVQHLETVVTDDEKVIPLLFCVYTGLRVSELVQLSTRHLDELQRRLNLISIVRKQKTQWSVLYHDKLTLLITHMIRVYEPAMLLLLQDGIDTPIFRIGVAGLLARAKQCYLSALHESPHKGFGLHTIRYYLATKWATLGDWELARRFLGHKHVTTTQLYVRADDVTLHAALSGTVSSIPLYADIMSNT